MSRLISAALFLLGCLFIGQGGYMDAKASLSQVLIDHAWDSRAAQSRPNRPWWWADTRPVAQMVVPRLNKRVYVMQDSSGESLAFGPGHMNGSAQPATDGHVLIAGHRDSHFAFLGDVEIADVIETTHYNKSKKRYRVTDIRIIDIRYDDLTLLEHNALTLITCYPLDSIVPNGPERLLVNAVEI